MSKATELGSSLLSQKRARDDRFRNRQESFQKRRAWTELLLPPVIDAGTRAIAESALSKDREMFATDPNAMAAASTFELANKNAEEVLRIKKAIDATGGTASEYIYNQQYPSFLARAEAELQSRNDGSYKLIGEVGPFKASVQKELQELSSLWGARFDEAYNALQGTGTAEERAARLSELSNTVNPKRFGDLVFQKARSAFGGRSREELEDKAMQDLMNSPLYKNNNKFNTLADVFNKERNLISAYDMSGLTEEDLGGEDFKTDDDRMFIIEPEMIKYIGTDGLLVLQKKTTKTHRNTGEVEVTFGAKEVTTFEDPNETPEMRVAATIKALPDLLDMANQQLNRDAYGALMKEAGEDNIKFTNFRSVAEYNAFGELLKNKMVENKNLRDPAKEAAINAFWARASTTFVEIDAIIATMSDDPNEKTEAVTRLNENLAEMFKLQNAFSGSVRSFMSNTDTGNSDTVDWDD